MWVLEFSVLQKPIKKRAFHMRISGFFQIIRKTYQAFRKMTVEFKEIFNGHFSNFLAKLRTHINWFNYELMLNGILNGLSVKPKTIKNCVLGYTRYYQ
jgi:hypothetical protein